MENVFEKFFNRLVVPIDKEKFETWIDAVANKITEIAVNLNDSNLIETILDDSSFNSYDDTLLMMFNGNTDIEKAAYEILNIMLKNKNNNES